MKHILTKEPKEIKEDAPIKKATEYSYRVTLPKKVIEMFPELKDDAKMVFEIKQINLNEYECDITFQAKGMTIAENERTDSDAEIKQESKEVKKFTPNNDKVKPKTKKKPSQADNKKTDSDKKINPHDFKDVTTENKIYTITVTDKPTYLKVMNGKTEIDKLFVKNKSYDTVHEVINKILENNPNDNRIIHDILNEYRPSRYHK